MGRQCWRWWQEADANLSRVTAKARPPTLGELNEAPCRTLMLYIKLSSPVKELAMGFSTDDVVPFTQAHANLPELDDQVKAGTAGKAAIRRD